MTPDDLGRAVCRKPIARFREGLGRGLRATILLMCGAVLVCGVGPRAGVPRAMSADFERIKYHHPGLVVDLGVGLWAWPLPMDYDGDGDMDLLVGCPDKPYNGLYWFENPGGGSPAQIVFKPAVRIGPAARNMTIAYVDGQPRLYTPGRRHPDFRTRGFAGGEPFRVSARLHPRIRSVRANQWKEVDYDGDGDHDLIVGIGDWTDYGWDDAYDAQGHWTNGPLHGYVYVAINRGTDAQPQYDDAWRLEAGGKVIDVYGMPSPNFADFDGDGDLDLICGEFIDRLHYFENVGTRTAPRYAAPRPLSDGQQAIRMELCMIVPVAVDFDQDGDVDLVVGQEDGRVAWIEHTGEVIDGVPRFLPPRFFRQQADAIKVGALVTPSGCDWDGDGDDDLICGNTAGFIEWVENLGGQPVRWAAPRRLKAGGRVFRIMAGENGSIQGPCEAKWGYTVPWVADWNGDGLLDIVLNSIWGTVLWLKNVGRPGHPVLAAAQEVEVAWPEKPIKPAWVWWQPKPRQLVTQWRTTPAAVDVNEDGLVDLVMLDHDGYLALYERRRVGDRLELLPGKRIFSDERGDPLRLNRRRGGSSGRRKFVFFDLDRDGTDDLVVNGAPNVDWLRSVSKGDGLHREYLGPLAKRVLAGHTTCPAVADVDGDGRRELVVGGEDGFLYRLVE